MRQSLNIFPLASTVTSWLNTSPAVTEGFLKWQENEELWVARWAAGLLSCVLRRQPTPANAGQRVYLCNFSVSSGSSLAHLNMLRCDWLISVFKWLNKQLKCNFFGEHFRKSEQSSVYFPHKYTHIHIVIIITSKVLASVLFQQKHAHTQLHNN